MKKILPLVPIVMFGILPCGRIQAQNAELAPATAASSNTLQRNYPGGRDDSDLTVQPRKMITKKETNLEDSFEEDSPEYDGSVDSEDFGE